MEGENDFVPPDGSIGAYVHLPHYCNALRLEGENRFPLRGRVRRSSPGPLNGNLHLTLSPYFYITLQNRNSGRFQNHKIDHRETSRRFVHVIQHILCFQVKFFEQVMKCCIYGVSVVNILERSKLSKRQI